MSIVEDLMDPLKPIMDLMAPFQEVYELVVGSFDAIKDAYQTLRDG